jgi:hypothetical protein
MRRLLIIMAIVCGLWVLVLLLLRASRAAEPAAEVAEPPAEPHPVAEAEPAAAPVPEAVDDTQPIPVFDTQPIPVADVRPEPAPDVVAAPPARESGEGLQAEVLRLRAQIDERVERRALFSMAEERHVPYFRLFFMTKHELLEAIMEAERIPPPDVLPSADTVERVRAIAQEALRRQDEVADEEAAQSQAG